MSSGGRIALIGVGNEFRRDDGVGWAVIGRLRERAGSRPLPPDVELAVCDGDPGRLIGLWEGARLAVVVDAAHAHPGSPGRVHRFALDTRFPPRSANTSSHGFGLGEAIELARVLDRLPERLIVYAVEGAESELGTGLSPAVGEAVDPLARTIENDVTRVGDHPAGGRS
ncbi:MULTISPECIES: hydrogenase maturation protease [Streptomyces]|uniref:hydrogenase maturation protease n=1 Tax=Streptomyces TaxID=1883 RepID=UPI002FDC429E